MLLETRSVEKVWGRDVLPAPFAAPPGQRIGEIWFVPPPEFDALLVKYIFTSEKLSVQVHPSAAQAAIHGGGGKEECWLVVDAEPGAQLGIGLVAALGEDELRAAALDGSIERLLDWRTVSAGDFFCIPSGTIHAIGGGVSLVEIQQNSDTTYRLYDYGRPRPLHLEQAVSVARAEPYGPSLHRKVARDESATLVDGPHFQLDLLAGAPDGRLLAAYDGPLLVIPLAGEVTVAGEAVGGGQCALASRLAEVAVPAQARVLLARPLA